MGSVNSKAGNVEINAQGAVNLKDGSFIANTVQSEAMGKSGDINITTGSLSATNGAALFTSSGGKGDAGSITINARDSVSFDGVIDEDNSGVFSDVESGGGNIKITAREVFGIQPRERQTPESDITASSDLGIAGTIQINTSNLDPSRGFVELPVNLVDPSTQIAQGCTPGSNVASRQNRFTITGRGGLPASLNEIFPGEETLVELLELPDSKNSHDAASQNIPASPSPPSGTPAARQGRTQSPAEGNPPAALSHRVSASSSHPQEIVEAQGWVVDADGAITLVAEVPNTIPHSPALTPASCQTSMQQ